MSANDNGALGSNDAINSTPIYTGAGDVEKGYRSAPPISRFVTPGGHAVDFSQPAIPVQHRKFGNPLPAGLFSFAVGLGIVGLYTVGARGVSRPHVAFPLFTLFLGITQTLTGWFEMFIGNTFSATIFICYGGFVWSFSALYLPAFGILEAYTVDGVLLDEFNQAVGMFLLVWAFLTFLFMIAALRSSVAILATLFFVMMSFILMGINSMVPSDGVRIASGAFEIIASCFGFWAALAGYWTPDVTYRVLQPSPIDLRRED